MTCTFTESEVSERLLKLRIGPKMSCQNCLRVKNLEIENASLKAQIENLKFALDNANICFNPDPETMCVHRVKKIGKEEVPTKI